MIFSIIISLKIVSFFIFLLLLGLWFHIYEIAYYCPRDQKVFTDFFPLSFQPATSFRYCTVSTSLLRTVPCSFTTVILSFHSLHGLTVAISVFAHWNTSVISQLFLLTPPPLFMDHIFLFLLTSYSFNDVGKHLGNIWILVSSFNGCWLLFRQVFVRPVRAGLEWLLLWG